ncbi:MAG: methyltransferase domain-containing protein [Oscillospiraceae bacterium]
MPSWDAAQYLKFEQERTQPAEDLAARVALQNPKKVLDVGCGPGNSTAVLARRFPTADILGIDSSADMVAAARTAHPALRFVQADAAGDLSALGAGFDLVFSNACIQWVPNHRALLPRLLGLLRSGGALAVQTPFNQRQPIHRILSSLAKSPRWRPFFPQPRLFYNLSAGGYFDLLHQHAAAFSLWQTTYFHALPGHEAILEWYRGTGLRPYLEALPTEEDRAAFEQAVFAAVQAAYPQRSGGVIFRFPRLFFTATAR